MVATLDPEIEEALRARGATPPLGLDRLAEARQFLAAMDTLASTEAVTRQDYVVPGTPGAPEVTVRVHVPTEVQPAAPCLYHIHGGGYVLGHRSMDDPRFDRWCADIGLVGVSVEYRLAPETPYPGPLDDCYAGLKWVFEHANDLGIDPARIGIGGASAGGGLAAALALLARDRGELPVAFQMLAYPMIDDRQTTETSGWQVPTWTPADNEFGWRCYLGDLYGRDVPYLAAPSRSPDLSGLPPALVYVGTLDGFCDEDVVYAMRLYQAGVATELHVYPGLPHGFETAAPNAEVTKRCQRMVDDWLARMVAPTS
jgi:acetyl esterase/lipase